MHLRMARAALGWSVRELEARSGVGRNTISRYEGVLTKGQGIPYAIGSDRVRSSLRSLSYLHGKPGFGRSSAITRLAALTKF